MIEKKPVKYSILLIVKYSILFSNTLWLFRSFLQLWELSSLVIKAHFSLSGCYYKSADSFHSSSFPKVSIVRSVGSLVAVPLMAHKLCLPERRQSRVYFTCEMDEWWVCEHLWRCLAQFLRDLSYYKFCWAVSHSQLLHENSSVVLPVQQDKHDGNCDKAPVVRKEQPPLLLKVWAGVEMAHISTGVEMTRVPYLSSC